MTYKERLDKLNEASNYRRSLEVENDNFSQRDHNNLFDKIAKNLKKLELDKKISKWSLTDEYDEDEKFSYISGNFNIEKDNKLMMDVDKEIKKIARNIELD